MHHIAYSDIMLPMSSGVAKKNKRNIFLLKILSMLLRKFKEKFKDFFLLPRLIHNKTIYVMLLKHVLDIYPKYSFKRKQIF